jgi:UDP-N-acetylmuramate-alanine ligase
LEAEVREGDVILTLGAGDIYKLSEWLVEETPS